MSLLRMKLSCPFRILLLVLGIFFLQGSLNGQTAPPPGYFRFVNAAGLTGKVSLTVGSLKLKPEGFSSGDTTGSIGIIAGTQQFTVATPEAGTASAALSVQPNGSTTMIAYCKVAIDPRTNAAKKTLQLLQRPNPPPDNRRNFQLLYVSSQPAAEVVLNGTTRRIDAMRELNGEELPGGDIKLEQAGKVIVTFTAPQAGNFLVVLYDDASGKLAGVVVPDYK